MPIDMTIYLDDRPGQVAAVGSALAAAKINIDGGFALVVNDQGIMHILVADADAATDAYLALEKAGLEATNDQEVLVLDIEDRPGALAEMTTKIADAGVNITILYFATATRLVLGADDLAAARAALGLQAGEG